MEELALAFWRLSKWVESAEVEHKMAANSALRQIKKYLDSNNIEVIDYLGQQYDSGFAIDVLGRKSGEELQEEDLVIVETVRPIILKDGEVIKYGQVFLGVPSTEQTNAPTSFNAGKMKSMLRCIDAYCEDNGSDAMTSWLLKICKSRLEKQQKVKERK